MRPAPAGERGRLRPRAGRRAPAAEERRQPAGGPGAGRRRPRGQRRSGWPSIAPGSRSNQRGLLTVNEHYQTAVPAHLRRRRRHRLPRARLHLDGAGPRRHGPRLRPPSTRRGWRRSSRWPSTPSPRSRWSARPRRPASRRSIDYCVGRALLPHQRPRPDHRRPERARSSWSSATATSCCSASTSSARTPPSWSTSASWLCRPSGTIDTFIHTVFNYPTLGDAYKYAAYDGLGAVQRRAATEASS